MISNIILRRTITRRVLYRPLSYSHIWKQSQFPNSDSNVNGKGNNDTQQIWNDKLNLVKSTSNKISNQYKRLKQSLQLANIRYKQHMEENNNIKLNNNDSQSKSGIEQIEGLPSERLNHRRKSWSQKLEIYMDSLQETLFTASRAFNDVTGYSSIQKLRKEIFQLEQTLNIKKDEVKQCKIEYNDSIQLRLQSQHEVNELLTRKNSWDARDLDRFTQLYKDDTINSQKVEQLKSKLQDLEMEEDQVNDKLYKAILTRYHEEQIWSDKIRSTSTWGTFTLMGINICLFLILQLILEPWKRRRLTRAFEDKVKVAIETYSGDNSQSNEILNILHKTQNKLDEDRDEDRKREQKQNTQTTAGPALSWSNISIILTTLWCKLKRCLLVGSMQEITMNSSEMFVYSGGLIVVSNVLLHTISALFAH